MRTLFRYFSLTLAIGLGVVVLAQQPVSVNGLIPAADIDYFTLGTSSAFSGMSGDTSHFTAWLPSTLIVNGATVSTSTLLPSTSGLPVIGQLNDGNNTICGGPVAGLIQLSALPSIGVTGTNANTLISPFPHATTTCPFNADNGWGQSYTSPYCAGCAGTWKGGDGIVVDGKAFINFYRQDSPGTHYGDSTLFMSPDAGNHWIDFQHYFTYPVTVASCSSGTITLTATNALAGNENVYVHDLGAGWDGMWTLTGASGSAVTFHTPASCPSAATISGESAFGLLTVGISTPDGPNNAAYSAGNGSMMWVGDSQPMTWFMFLRYGRNNQGVSPPDSGCDPATYTCGIAVQRHNSGGSAANESTFLWRVPRGHEFTKSQYQWYTCPGYNPIWPLPETVCNGNNAASWTSTLASATSLRDNSQAGMAWPGNCGSIKYLTSHQSYVLGCNNYLSGGYVNGRFAYLWGPHPWGPFYPVWSDSTLAGPLGYDWNILMDYGENIISSGASPKTQVEIASLARGTTASGASTSANSGGNTVVTRFSGPAFDSAWIGHNFCLQNIACVPGSQNTSVVSVGGPNTLTVTGNSGTSGTNWAYGAHSSGFNPAMQAVEFGSGKAPAVGFARRMFSLNNYQNGMGHRLSSAPQRGAIPLKGPSEGGGSWSMAWWADFFDHGGSTAGQAGYRGAMRDIISGGSNRFLAKNQSVYGYGINLVLNADGVTLDGQNEAFDSTFNDTVMVGNSSWTFIGVLNFNEYNHGSNGTGSAIIHTGGQAYGSTVSLEQSAAGYVQSGAICHFQGGWGGTNTGAGGVGSITCTSPMITTGVWQFIAVRVKANISGPPTLNVMLCASGTCTNYPSTFTAGGMTPNSAAGQIVRVGVSDDYGNDSINGKVGEIGMASGLIPDHVAIDIYRTLRDDWLRTGRGAL